MKTLKEHNDEAWKAWSMANREEAKPNGISCPECFSELVDLKGVRLLSIPPQCHVLCPNCGYKGFRVC